MSEAGLFSPVATPAGFLVNEEYPLPNLGGTAD
jgi:hypothetical protein